MDAAELKLFGLEGEPMVSGDIGELAETGELQIGTGADGQTVRYVLEADTKGNRRGLYTCNFSTARARTVISRIR